MRWARAPLAALALLRRCPASDHGGRRAHPETQRPSTVEHLLVDIDESVRKATGDAELVFATLYTYDQQLEESLGRELGAMNETLGKLSAMRATYHAEVGKSQAELRSLDAAAQSSAQNASSHQAAAIWAGRRLDSLLGSVKVLMKVLQNAVVTPDGTLATPETPDSHGEPPRTYSAIRRLLAANRAIQPYFPDVFTAFVPTPQGSLRKGASRSSRSSQAAAAQPPRVKMTQALLRQTISAMRAIQSRTEAQRSQSLAEFASKQRSLMIQAASDQSKGAEQQGMEAENEQVVEELSFSITFTEAVLKMDRAFHEKVHDSMKSKADIVENIRKYRESQLKTLKDLIDLLSGKYVVDDRTSPRVLAFLEVQSRKGLPQGNLLFEIETALQQKADTHGFLVRIKAMLDEVSAIDATGVQNAVAQLKSVLHAVDSDQARADDAKQRCEAQQLHAIHEEQELNSTLALMSSVRTHTEAAIWVAKSNLKRIEAKTHALQASAKVMSHTVSQAMKTLLGQSKDRATIMSAVEKAKEVIKQSMEKSAAVALLDQMHKEFAVQEQWERAYRKEESAFHAAFLAYVRDYLQVLKERRGHYERSLSALELYTSEVEGDVAAQSDALGASRELKHESQDFCASILKFYDEHRKRRLQLTLTLKGLLPKMPELLSVGIKGTPAAEF